MVKLTLKSILFLLLTFSISTLAAQEIKVTEFRNANSDITARERVVMDPNGDACAIMKVRTNLKNIQFSSDIGIQKAEAQEGEYWLWISPNASKLYFEAEGFPRLEYVLPETSEQYNVYIILLTILIPDRVLYKSINTRRIITKPKKAEIFSDGIFLGYSPVDINTSSDTFQYEIRRKKYLTINSTLNLLNGNSELNVSLKKNPDENWVFLNLYLAGGNKFSPPFSGFETGMIGKTGWYISFTTPTLKRAIATVSSHNYGTNNVLADTKKFLKVVGEPSESYYIRLKDVNNNFYKHFRLKAGITQKIFKDAYLKAGVGLGLATQWYKLEVIPYSNDPKTEIPLNKTFYGKTDNPIQGLLIETGFAYRVFRKYLINFNISSTGFSAWENPGSLNFFFPFEGSFGIGYNFI